MKVDNVKTELIKSETQFIQYLNGLNDEQFLQSYNDKWTIKDVFAHILWYEEEMVKLFESRSMIDSDSIWNNSFERRNELIYNVMAEFSLKEIRRRHNYAIKALIESLDELTDDYMINPKLFKEMPEEWKPWEILAQNTFYHYNEHLSLLKNLV